MKKTIHLNENQYNKLFEVRYIDAGTICNDKKKHKKDPNQIEFQEPIKNNDTIRVFHGCDLETAVRACMYGISGKEAPAYGRSYSYEAGMNPLGWFVTTDFYRAKSFGLSYDGRCVLEFSAKGSDLESPVWNDSDSYFVQGSNPMPFKNADERNAQKMKYREMALNLEDEYTYDYYRDKEGNLLSKRIDFPRDFIRKSDKPEMAYNIFMNSENQALFMGDLNPNMIKRVWVKLPGEKKYITDSDPYIPMSRKDFIRKFGNREFYVMGSQNKYKKLRSDKLYLPKDNFTSIDDFVTRYAKRWGDKIDTEEEFENLKNNLVSAGFFDKDKVLNLVGIEYLRGTLWPKQIKQIYGEDFFNDNFNRLGQ